MRNHERPGSFLRVSPLCQDRLLPMSGFFYGAQKKGPKEGPKEREPKKGDHIHWWTINEFIDGPSMNSLMDVHQWVLKILLFGETENWRPGVYFDAEYVSTPSCHVKTAWIAIWSKIRKPLKTKITIWEGPQEICFWGSFIGKLIGFIWRSKDHLEDEDPSGPIWRTKGHLVMKGLSKNVENHRF